MAKKPDPKPVESIKHQDKRRNIPTAEYRSVMDPKDMSPVQLAYHRRNPDLDPQLVWRGKDITDDPDLEVQAPPIYIQEKIHPKVLIEDLIKETQAAAAGRVGYQADLFADFNGLPSEEAKTEFYQHDLNWSNRMILGDSLQVMASLAEREGLRGQVQCIYLDPPYGIKFNSNFQWSTTSRDVKDGDRKHITREPEQVKAFRDTWRDGIHSYLSYLRDRLIVARDLLSESGSIFVQIGDENVHRVRALVDEVFGEHCFVATIAYAKTSGFSGNRLSNVLDYLVWYCKNPILMKYRHLYIRKTVGGEGASKYRPVSSIKALANSTFNGNLLVTSADLTSQGEATTGSSFDLMGRKFSAPQGLHWKTTVHGLVRLTRAQRIMHEGATPRYVRFLDDFSAIPRNNAWLDIGGVQSRTDPKVYVVQTATEAVARCVLMTTDPGDLVLDPTCGSGTTAYVAEQWGRRWITIDTSRVALALARARLMGARYPYYLLADSKEGQLKEAELSQRDYTEKPTYGNVRQGFVYERIPRITLKSIANNAEIDVIWEQWQPMVQGALAALNRALRGHSKPFKVVAGGREGQDVRFNAPEGAKVTLPSKEEVPTYELLEWEVPRDAPQDWPAEAKQLHAEFWELRISRQAAMDASISAKAEYEYLYDKPFVDNKKVRVAGPFTVEGLSPHRVLGLDENDELIDPMDTLPPDQRDFAQMVIENLKRAGVQQSNKEDRITFTSLTPWPGNYVCAEGRFMEGESVRRAAVFVGPEFGTVSRPDLVEAAKEAGEAGFDLLIACAFNYEALTTEFSKLGTIKVLKARMNADLHMSEELKNTGSGNLFVIFGEPAIQWVELGDDKIQITVEGVDVYDPNSGEIRSDSQEGIACWFIDTDYNQESFFVRHAYFLGQNDPYGALKTSLKAEINQDAWESLNSATSRPFDKPASGRIAVKVINHLGDEVMKVFRIGTLAPQR